MARAHNKDSPSRRAYDLKPFPKPANHQPDAGNVDSAQEARKDNNRSGILDLPKDNMGENQKRSRTRKRGPKDPPKIMQPDITPQSALDAE
jgi:hypothetical protein